MRNGLNKSDVWLPPFLVLGGACFLACLALLPKIILLDSRREAEIFSGLPALRAKLQAILARSVLDFRPCLLVLAILFVLAQLLAGRTCLSDVLCLLLSGQKWVVYFCS